MSEYFPGMISAGGLLMIAVGCLLCIFNVVSIGPFIAMAAVGTFLIVFGIVLGRDN